MDQYLLGKIQKKIKKKILRTFEIQGGCVSPAYKLEVQDGSYIFCKTNPVKSEMFFCEQTGLLEIGKFNFKVPSVICSEDQFILMEYISPGLKDKDTFYNLGKSLASMHLIRGEKFGFKEDNFIGKNIQKNTQTNSWLDFYFENRLKVQYQLAESKKNLCNEMIEGFVKLEKKVHKIIDDNNSPSLLHGDLWTGNVLVNENSEAILIDPAVYYGNREAEFGIIRLFGGFNNDFFNGYNEVFPLDEGWVKRNKIYQLYHLFNHLNLFGRGYSGKIIEAMRYYI